jgi:hypothetical protein
MITGANNSEILTIKEPVLDFDEIETGNYTDPASTVADKTKYMGNSSPYIKINGYELDSKSIIKFKIDTVGFIPTISLVFDDITKQFQNDFPKDGDLIELYIRSRNNSGKKKIRINFDILNIQGFVSRGTNTYKLNGIMKIPNIFSEQQVSFPSDTSYNHLLTVCDLMNIGFASNETNTSDSMPRFNANNTLKDFIEKTLETSYKNDETFYTGYIDLYYYLTFVNVNSLFSMDETLEDGVGDLISELTEDKSNEKESVDEEGAKIILSNHPKFDNSTNYIKEYSLFNNAGDIWMKNGYKRYSQFLDMDTYEFKSFFIDPLTTEGAESNLVLLKGKAGDNSYQNQNKFRYLGRQYTTLNEGNLHPNYHYAKILNFQNNKELNKMGLTVILQDISSSVSKYKRIPVAIYEKDGNIINNASMEQGDKQRGTSVEQEGADYTRPENYIANSFISGFYVIRDFNINWDRVNGFTQTVNLVRREWAQPYSAGVAKNKK